MGPIHQPTSKPVINVQDAMAMVKLLADGLAKREHLELIISAPTLKPSTDLTRVLAHVRLPENSEQRTALENYALMANIAYLYLKKHYDISH
jgi:hypothetical protein